MMGLEKSYFFAKRRMNESMPNQLDLSNITFFTPTMLLLLLNFSKEKSLPIEVTPGTLDYVKKVLGIIPCTDTTLPFKELPKKEML